MELTEDQKQALLRLKEIQSGRRFIGTSPEVMEQDFRRINESRVEADSGYRQKLDSSERALFAICGYTPPIIITL